MKNSNFKKTNLLLLLVLCLFGGNAIAQRTQLNSPPRNQVNLQADFNILTLDAVTFTFAPVGVPSQYSVVWKLGDGTVSTQQSPTHGYSVPGQYFVTLIVCRGKKVMAERTKVITVR